MDNPSKNTPSYQEYLDPNTQKPGKSRKKTILLIVAVILLLLIILPIAIVLSGKKSNNNNSSQNQSGIIACADEQCFSDHFLQCLPASYNYKDSLVSIKYTTLGPAQIGCSTEAEYLSSASLPNVVGKKMTCDFDNEISFKAAATNAFKYPDDFDCKGELADTFKKLNPADTQ